MKSERKLPLIVFVILAAVLVVHVVLQWSGSPGLPLVESRAVRAIITGLIAAVGAFSTASVENPGSYKDFKQTTWGVIGAAGVSALLGAL